MRSRSLLLALLTMMGCATLPGAKYPNLTVTQYDSCSEEEAAKLRAAAELASTLLESAEFAATMQQLPASAIDHRADKDGKAQADGATVLREVKQYAHDHPIEVECYLPFFFWKTVGRDGGQGPVAVNWHKVGQRSVEQWAGTMLHEIAHKVSYFHDGNARKGNECTAPYLLGDLAVKLAPHAAGTFSWPETPCPVIK